MLITSHWLAPSTLPGSVTAPVVVDISGIVAEAGGSAISINAIAQPGVSYGGLLASLVYQFDTTGTQGTSISANTSGVISYTPPATAQVDTFDFRIQDATGLWSNYATVTVDVQAPPADEMATLMLSPGSVTHYFRMADQTGATLLEDSSGNNNDATISGTPTFGVDNELTDPTNLGRAITWGGSASASVTYAAANSVTEIVEFKATQADIDNGRAILNRNANGNNVGNHSLRLEAGGGIKWFHQDGTSQTNLLAPSGTVIAGNWYAVARTMAPTGVGLYVNGILTDSSSNHTIGEVGSDIPMTIAASNYTTNFAGTTRSYIRYSKVLTAAEIEARSFFTASAGGGGGGSGGGEDPLAETALTTAVRSVNVANQTQLNAALGDLRAGDRIRLSNGSYSGFTITTGGTSADPIVFEAVNVLGARFTSQIFIDAPNITLYGTDHTSRIVVGLNSSAPNFKFWRCRLRDISGIALRTYAAADPDFAFSEWDNIQGRGCLVSYSPGTRRPVWRYCFFHDTPAGYGPQESGGAGECIHWDASGGPQSPRNPMNGLMYRCKIKAWNADQEQPSIKCSDNTVRQCTIEDCLGGSGGGRINIRFGYNNTIEACWSKNSGGISTRAGCTGSERNKILGNVIEDGGKITVMAGNKEPCDSSLNTKPWFNAAGWTIISGNTGPVEVGAWSSSKRNDPVRAQNVRVREHSGTITLTHQTGTDNQPGVTETSYTWVPAIYLNDADVGPFANL